MIEGKPIDWIELPPSQIRIKDFSEVPDALGLSTVRFTVTFAEVDRIMRVFEEAGRLERQRLAGRAKVRAALRQGRIYAAKRKQWEDYWEHLPIARAAWGNLR